ncbi:MAG: hypothetical protein ABI680_19085, partial [Chthoniobacteraceae bacterium]
TAEGKPTGRTRERPSNPELVDKTGVADRYSCAKPGWNFIRPRPTTLGRKFDDGPVEDEEE